MSADETAVLWVTDADNTLWDTNEVYARAQLGLVDELTLALRIQLREPDALSWLRSEDQAIAARHAQGLRYPPELLVGALASRLLDQEASSASPKSIDVLLPPAVVSGIVKNYLVALKAMPKLARGVLEGLEQLAANNARVVVVTEGARKRIEETLKHLGLTPLVEEVIEEKKSTSIFSTILASYDGASAWAVGDQLDRDVLPAVEAGFKGVYIEGGFQPSWHPEVDASAAYFICNDYADAVRTALKLRRSTQ